MALHAARTRKNNPRFRTRDIVDYTRRDAQGQSKRNLQFSRIFICIRVLLPLNSAVHCLRWPREEETAGGQWLIAPSGRRPPWHFMRGVTDMTSTFSDR